MKYRKCLPWNGLICDLCALVRKLACPFGYPTQVSMQVQLAATCESVWPRLNSAVHSPFIFHNLVLNASSMRSFLLCLCEWRATLTGKIRKMQIKMLLESPRENSKSPCCDVILLFYVFPKAEVLWTVNIPSAKRGSRWGSSFYG